MPKKERGKLAGLPLLPKNADFIGGAEGGRTPDLRIANAALCQTELLPHVSQLEGNIREPVRLLSSIHVDSDNPLAGACGGSRVSHYGLLSPSRKAACY
jgi:hypothetical protein